MISEKNDDRYMYSLGSTSGLHLPRRLSPPRFILHILPSYYSCLLHPVTREAVGAVASAGRHSKSVKVLVCN
jgi:hypothetical protein